MTKGILQVNTVHQNKGFDIIRIRLISNQFTYTTKWSYRKSNTKTKIKSIGPRHFTHRKNRGLLNTVGLAPKFLFGIMENENRNDI